MAAPNNRPFMTFRHRNSCCLFRRSVRGFAIFSTINPLYGRPAYNKTKTFAFIMLSAIAAAAAATSCLPQELLLALFHSAAFMQKFISHERVEQRLSLRRDKAEAAKRSEKHCTRDMSFA